MNHLNTQERAKIIGCLVEGDCVRATSRFAGGGGKNYFAFTVSLGAAQAAKD